MLTHESFFVYNPRESASNANGFQGLLCCTEVLFFMPFYIGVLLALKKCVSDAKSAVEKGGFCQCFTNFFVVFNKKGECKM